MAQKSGQVSKEAAGGLVAASTDSVNVSLMMDVIGSKLDTPVAVPSGVASQTAYLKGLLESLSTVLFVPLDYVEIDITNVAGTVTLASRTPTVAELINSKTGSGGEIDKIELWLQLSALDTSGAANDLDCSTVTHNQLQINIAAGGAVDCPFGMHGGITGQFADTDLRCAADGSSGAQLMADVSKLGAINLEDNILQAIVVTLQNARSTGNMRLKATTFLRVLYNGKCRV